MTAAVIEHDKASPGGWLSHAHSLTYQGCLEASRISPRPYATHHRNGWHTGTMMAKPMISLVLLALTALAGCDSDAPPAPLSKQAQATRDAAPEQVFKGVLAGQPVFLLVHDCEVFLVEPLEKGEVHWEKVLTPEPYPFFTSCQRQSIRYEAGVLQVTLGRMAFGAGGCCATGGDYRSTDGRSWKKTS